MKKAMFFLLVYVLMAFAAWAEAEEAIFSTNILIAC